MQRRGQGLNGSEELYLLTCIFFPLSMKVTQKKRNLGEIESEGEGGSESSHIGRAGLLACWNTRSQTVLEQREGSMLGLGGADLDSMLWPIGRVSGSY